MPSVDEIRASMDARYQQGDAYSYELLWDVSRHERLHDAVRAQVIQATNGPDVDLYDIPGHTLRMMDVGCGVESAFDKPAFLRAMGSVCRLDLTFVDISANAIERLRATNALRHSAWEREYEHQRGEDAPKLRRSFTYKAAAAEDLLPGAANDASVDLMVSVESIEHWADVEAALSNLHRLLRRGGSIVLTTPNRDSFHVQMARKLGMHLPYCASDHTHEFGWDELDRTMQRAGFTRTAAAGVCFQPYWGLELALGDRMRSLAESDPDVVAMFESIGARCPELAFCQVKTFRKDG